MTVSLEGNSKDSVIQRSTLHSARGSTTRHNLFLIDQIFEESTHKRYSRDGCVLFEEPKFP